MQKIIPPSHCPSCDSPLVLQNDQLFCKNKLCPAQSLKKLEHFCKSIKAKGFGPAALTKLDFESILDLFTFSESHYKDTLGDTIGTKLFAEIRNAEKHTTLNRVIAGLSIPLVGETVADKLCGHITSFSDINLETCKKAGLGDKVTHNLLAFMESEEYFSLKKLLSHFPVQAKPSVKSNSLKVCITGKLLDFKNRSDAARYLESLGYTVVDSVTKATDILINEEDRPSAKLAKAQSLGLMIATIKDLEKDL